MPSLPLLRRGTGALVLAAGFIACEGSTGAPSSPDPTESGSAPPASSAAPPVALGHPAGPVHAGDFPDPFVLVTDSAYFAFATNVGSANVPVLRSTDLATWMPAGDAMPSLPSWAVGGRHLTWAPAVVADHGRYVLFFTARDRRSGRQCIGRAESSAPAGPFVDASSAPFVCQTELGGSIDPSLVHDASGRLYLLWKNDGNCCGKPVTLWSQRLSAEAQTPLDAPAPLLGRDRAWEGPLIEAPTMWWEAGRWRLLYSANTWDSERYAVGYAECESPLGPCRKLSDGPVLSSDGETSGPGGAEVFTDLAGRRWIAYHGWTAGAVGYARGGARSFRLDRIAVSDSELAAALRPRHEGGAEH
jgi:beta-xylosidase